MISMVTMVTMHIDVNHSGLLHDTCDKLCLIMQENYSNNMLGLCDYIDYAINRNTNHVMQYHKNFKLYTL